MSNPLPPATGSTRTGAPQNDQRRDTSSKLLPVLDVIYALLGAVLAVFGRRKGDRE